MSCFSCRSDLIEIFENWFGFSSGWRKSPHSIPSPGVAWPVGPEDGVRGTGLRPSAATPPETLLPSCKPVIGVTQTVKQNKTKQPRKTWKKQRQLYRTLRNCSSHSPTTTHTPRPSAHSHTLPSRTQGWDEQVSSAYWCDGKLSCPKTPRLAGPAKVKGLHLHHWRAGAGRWQWGLRFPG